jgi:hypothetical protein
MWFGAQLNQTAADICIQFTDKYSSDIWYSEGFVSFDDANLTNFYPFEQK